MGASTAYFVRLLIVTCIDHPAAANQTFLVSDGQDLSTSELLQQMAFALGKSPRLFSVPKSWLKTAARLVGKDAVAQRLLASLQVDICKNQQLLNWVPPVDVKEALEKTATHYLAQA